MFSTTKKGDTMSMRITSGAQGYAIQEQMSLDVQSQMQQGKSRIEAVRSVCMKWNAQIARSLVVTGNDKRAVERGIEGMSGETRAALVGVYNVILRTLGRDMQEVRAYQKREDGLRVVTETMD
jgi:hypothetical protein